MNILITGASGLIGTALIKSLTDNGHLVYCQSRYKHCESKQVKWIKHDLINDSWKDFDLPEFDVIYHLAAQTSVYKSKENPLNDLSVNVIGLLNLLEHFKRQSFPPFVVVAGTATQVGLTNNLVINETLQDQPVTFYDVGKIAAEMYLKQYVKEGWVEGCALRFSNVYGRINCKQSQDRGIIDRVFRSAISGQNIYIYGDGNFLRDYIFIDDVVTALLFAINNKPKVNGRHYYIASGQRITLKEAFLKVVEKASQITGKVASIEHIKQPLELSEIEFRNAVVDSSAFRRATGWIPKYDFLGGLDEAYNDFAKDIN